LHDFTVFQIEGIRVAAVDLQRACRLVAGLAIQRLGTYVTVTGAHGLVESCYDPRIRQAHQSASLVLPDGMPLVWLGRALGHTSMGRVYGPDLIQAIFSEQAFRELRHFFYGSQPQVLTALMDRLTSRFGEFNLVGSYCPPMRLAGFQEDEEVLQIIRHARPHFIWIGLSTPKQELWMYMHMPKIATGVAVGIGAAFDLVAGSTPQAPRWMQRSGLEWLFRLIVDPRRLYRRYAFIVPRFFLLIVKTWMEAKRRGGT
jgi:N-acetylglucosaminyldiphosphoundecaprenol N-acetyl-beta-D-mannosaminyltransferase